jgi:PTS system mannose-specific IIA component
LIDLILISHAALAAGMREAAEMILGEQENLSVFGLYPGDTLDYFAAKIEQAIDACGSPENVLILSDLKCGTPDNAAMMMALKKGVTCMTGCNLPLLLDVLSMRDERSVKEIVELASETGKKGITHSVQIQAEFQNREGRCEQ